MESLGIIGVMGIDWQMVRLRYESGQTAYRISVDLGGRPSKQGIARRAKAENWQQRDVTALTVAEKLPIVIRAQNLSGPTKCTADRVAFILELIGRGSSQNLACNAAGVGPKTLKRWISEDPQLEEQIRQARAGKLADWTSCIDDAASRDWKAAKELLANAPDATDWQQQSAAGITIVLNIDRDQETPKGVTINAEPQALSEDA